MKELSIEEKAKRYDEVINRMKHYVIDEYGCSRIKVADVFPELKESDDDRMIQYFNDLAPFDKADELYEKYGFSHKDAIAWLEKQCEHANFLSKIQAGDKVTRNEDGVLVNLSQLNRVANKQVEHKPTIEMITPEESLGIDSDTYNKIVDECIYGEQKPAWSAEDTFMVQRICKYLDAAKKYYVDSSEVRECIDWLKSLKERYTWNPSEEQMNTLEYYMHTLICNEHKEVLFGLYADLKKLSEK